MTELDREQLRRDWSDLHGALWDGNQNAITWNLIHVLEKLAKGVE